MSFKEVFNGVNDQVSGMFCATEEDKDVVLQAAIFRTLKMGPFVVRLLYFAYL